MPTLKRTQVGVGLMFFQQFVGINALIVSTIPHTSNTEITFHSVADSSQVLLSNRLRNYGLDYEIQLTMSGVLNCCQAIACLWSLWGMDRFGRRKLLLAGGVCMFSSHFIIAVLVGKYNGRWSNNQAAAWTTVAFLLFYMLTFGATRGPIPWAMLIEIFPFSLRAKGCAFSTMSIWGNNFIIVSISSYRATAYFIANNDQGLITPPMIQNIGFGTYVFFAVFCALALVWVWFFVPETNGRTLEQMDSVFKDNSNQEELERRQRIEREMMREIIAYQEVRGV